MTTNKPPLINPNDINDPILTFTPDCKSIRVSFSVDSMTFWVSESMPVTMPEPDKFREWIARRYGYIIVLLIDNPQGKRFTASRN